MCEKVNQLSVINMLKETFPKKLVRLMSSEVMPYNINQIKYLIKIEYFGIVIASLCERILR